MRSNSKSPNLKIVGKKEAKEEIRKLTADEKLQLESSSYIEGLSAGYARGLSILVHYDLECKRAQVSCTTAKTQLEIEKTQGFIRGLLSALSEYGEP